MKHLYIILLVLPLIGFGQGWEQTFSGSVLSDCEGNSVQQTSDGGYIVCGGISNFEGFGNQVYLIKVDELGEEEWSQTFGGTDSDWGDSVQQTTDGGYIITGHTTSFGNGDQDVYLIKTDENGDEEWFQTYGGIYDDWSRSVQQTSDGGYVITGSTSSFENGSGSRDVYLIKTDGNGDEEWFQTYGDTEKDDWSRSVQQTSDGGYVITGHTTSFEGGEPLGEFDVYLIKTDNNGNEEWFQTFGENGQDAGYSVQQTTDEGYVITGYTYLSGGGGQDVYLIKTDGNGNEEWFQTFGVIDSSDSGHSVQQTSDGGYIIAGYTVSWFEGDYKIYLIKTDSAGNVETTSTIELPKPTSKRELIKTTNILGQENTTIKNQPMIEIYDDGSVEKKYIIE